VEQDRASPLFIYHNQLARQTPAQLPHDRPTDRCDDNGYRLKVRAELDENKYSKGVKVSDAQMAVVNLSWNYTISPPGSDATQTGQNQRA
jgi:hypothetical protein